MGVDVLVKRVEFRIIAFDQHLDRGLETGNIDLRARRQKRCRAQCCGRQKGFGKSVHGNNAPCHPAAIRRRFSPD